MAKHGGRGRAGRVGRVDSFQFSLVGFQSSVLIRLAVARRHHPPITARLYPQTFGSQR
jgi:hypothetical protein